MVIVLSLFENVCQFLAVEKIDKLCSRIAGVGGVVALTRAVFFILHAYPSMHIDLCIPLVNGIHTVYCAFAYNILKIH